ncbi:MAG: DUF2786 domain-containing protein [Oligoflexales bacterium]|nr:DUF2786 domain-containing protein [Oligoflexales bacterium]
MIDENFDFNNQETYLLRAWTDQLYKEHAHVCFYYRVKLSTPLIRIMDLAKKWGEWRSAERTIVISRQLISTYSWDHVLAVLKHEMAHQIVDEIFRQFDQHGPHFKKACGLLGLDTWASLSDFEMQTFEFHSPSRRLSADDERLLRRAEKLLALASSSNENEAQLAMLRVQELYNKYNFERIKSGEPGQYSSVFIKPKKKRLGYHYTLLASMLTKYFFVEVIFSSQYDAEQLSSFQVVEFLGEQKNVAMAEYVFGFMLQRLDVSYFEYKKIKSKLSQKQRNDFYHGVLRGFEERLKANRFSSGGTEVKIPAEALFQKSKALIPLKDPGLEEYVGFKHPRLRKLSRARRYLEAAVYQAGVTAGRKIVLNNALKSGPRGLVGLLLRS